MWITFFSYENVKKYVIFLDLTGFFVIIEMVFFKAEEVYRYENDISAEEKAKIKSAWFSEKNENSRRKKGIGCKKIKRKKKIVSLGHIFVTFSSIFKGLMK